MTSGRCVLPSRRTLGKLASVRADMIREPTAKAVFTIRSLAPLKDGRCVSTFGKGETTFLTGQRGHDIQCPSMLRPLGYAQQRETRAWYSCKHMS